MSTSDADSAAATGWIHDDELEGVVVQLSQAVVGRPRADGTGVIGLHGVGANCAEVFENTTFALRDFCWCEGGLHPEVTELDDAVPPSGGTSSGCPVNFEHYASGIKGTWYKHLGRDMRFSREALTQPDCRSEAIDVLVDCLVSLGYRRTRWSGWTG